MCTCEEIERGTHAHGASKLGLVEEWWTEDGKLRITIQDPSPESGRRTHLLYFTYAEISTAKALSKPKVVDLPVAVI